MAGDRIDEIAALLSEAEKAHHQYEVRQLEGATDANWARWYAGYLVEQGISAQVGHAVTVEDLQQFLLDSHDQFQTANTGETWTAYVARRIQYEL